MRIPNLRSNIDSSISRIRQVPVISEGIADKTLKRRRNKVQNLFLDFQWKWYLETATLAIFVKSRRTGISFTTACKSTVAAMKDEKNVFYSSYNLPACQEFIRNCAKFARMFSHAAKIGYGVDLLNEKNITTYSITFNNGRKIQAIPGNPVNLRDKDDCILILDEFAFRPSDQTEIVKAVMAAILWERSQILIISTHNGEDNEFNKLAQNIKSGKTPGAYHWIDFQTAIKQGLYKKVCELSNKNWTLENEIKYVQNAYDTYGEGAGEELDTIPRKYSTSAIFKEEYFRKVKVPIHEIPQMYKVRYFDLASTINQNSFYSATVMLGQYNDLMVILDAQAQKYEAAEGDDWIEAIIKSDYNNTIHLLEEEPGSSAKYIEYMKRRMQDKYIEGYPATKNKVIRAIPTVNMLKTGRLAVADKDYFVDNHYIDADQLIAIFCKFTAKPEPLITDLTDCLNGCVNYTFDNSGLWIDDSVFNSESNVLESIENPFDSNVLDILTMM